MTTIPIAPAPQMEMHMQMYFIFTYKCVWLFKSLKTSVDNPGLYWSLLPCALLISFAQQFLKALKLNKQYPIHDRYKKKEISAAVRYLIQLLYQLVYLTVNALVMLLIMTCNSGIVIACILGQILGYGIFNMGYDLKFVSGKKCK